MWARLPCTWWLGGGHPNEVWGACQCHLGVSRPAGSATYLQTAFCPCSGPGRDEEIGRSNCFGAPPEHAAWFSLVGACCGTSIQAACPRKGGGATQSVAPGPLRVARAAPLCYRDSFWRILMATGLAAPPFADDSGARQLGAPPLTPTFLEGPRCLLQRPRFPIPPRILHRPIFQRNAARMRSRATRLLA